MNGFRLGLGSTALDLVATVANRPGTARERLNAPADLDRWLIESGLATRPRSDEADLRAARELREAVWALVERSLQGAGPQASDRRLLNRWAAVHAPLPELRADWSVGEAAPTTVAAALAAVARDAVLLLGGPERLRIRKCGRCSLYFVDRSRPGNRRWCSMEVCGNRSKAASFRERHREPD